MTVPTKNFLPESEVQLNSEGVQINPSTIEKQQEIIDKMPALESNGAAPVNVQDQTTEIVDIFFCRTLNTVTLAATITIDTNTATLVAGHNFVAGDMFCLKEWSRFFQAEIINVATNTVTIDRPFDFAFTSASVATRTTKDMNVNWSVTPLIYRVTPVWMSWIKFDITKILFHIEDDSPMDNWTFWGLPKLTKWIVLRKKDWIYKSIFNAKDNGDFAHHCAVVSYDDKAPSWSYWIRIIKELSGQQNHWVVIRLDPANNDELQVIIQDDLTWLIDFHCVALWHVVQD